ncbi:ATP-binding protein [Streptomyces sp. NPDC050145]|uniref:ATP-binding protein n=1 Tax=Streptomyces sp. NPDC050145 TaxID=3365602 RepID=UPI0037BC84D6
MTLPCSSIDSPRRAREFTADMLRAHCVPRSVIDDLRLVTSELVTNCVQHACGDVVVRVSVSEDEAVVSATDHGISSAFTVESVSPDSERGRGLALVDALTDRLEIRLGRASTEVLAARRISADGPEVSA